jgi:hypothetical protein
MSKRNPQPGHQSPSLEGLPITLAGHPWVMPSLNAASARRHWERIRAMETGSEADPIGLTVTLVGECLRRNYPAVTDDWVAEHVDMDNWEALSAAVFGRGAFRRWADAQREHATSLERAPGNAPAPQPLLADGTGAPSTPASPLPLAGPSNTSTG